MTTGRDKPTRSFSRDFRTFFVRGLVILLPTVITLGLLVWAGRFLWNNVASPINRAVRWGVVETMPIFTSEDGAPEWYRVNEEQIAAVRDERIRQGVLKPTSDPIVKVAQDERIIRSIRLQNLAQIWSQRIYLEPIGLLIAIVLIYLVGVGVGNYLGRKAFAGLERVAIRVPIIKQVYPSVKQIVEFLVGGGDKNRSMLSGRVVAFEYPRVGLWTLGLMTGETVPAIEDAAGVPCVTVFVPSSPTPFTGYTVTVPRSGVVELPDVSLDEALKFVVSGGVVVPPRRKPTTLLSPDLAGSGSGGIMGEPGAPTPT